MHSHTQHHSKQLTEELEQREKCLAQFVADPKASKITLGPLQRTLIIVPALSLTLVFVRQEVECKVPMDGHRTKHSVPGRAYPPQSSSSCHHHRLTMARSCACQTYKFRNFRPMQEEAINAAFSSEDIFVAFATGAGKSLCYEVPL